LVAAEESADHLSNAAEYVEAADAREHLLDLVREREKHVEALREALCKLEDLPAAADPDRETAEQLLQRVRAWLAPEDGEASFIEQRLSGEEKLQSKIDDARENELSEENKRLLNALADNVRQTIRRLRALEASVKSK
jgi:DNA repair exonuclease SbcCD ATPase subunit